LPELQKHLIALYPHAEVYTFKGEGHFPYVNDAAEYNKILEKFFNEPEPVIDSISVNSDDDLNQ
jgi:pimeloyl-ACP methyl ester carboxylesterase